MQVNISMTRHTNALLIELSHARKQNKSECITKLIEEAFSKEPKIQNIIIKK